AEGRAGGDLTRGAVAYADWKEDVKILDANDWLERDIIKPTLFLWNLNPNSPDARLDPHARWWFYRKSEGMIPNFRYVVNDRPRAPASGEPFEVPKLIDAFAAQQHRNHRTALQNWLGHVRRATGTNDRGMMIQHAKWTALFVGGATAREIADNAYRH